MSKRVVLIDDSRTVTTTIEIALTELTNSEVITLDVYNNPEKLISKLNDSSFFYDLLISDINMAQINGLDLVEKFKQYDKFKEKPILILTAESQNDLKARGKELGVTGWITKPVSPEKLTKAVKMLLNLHTTH